MSLLDEAIKKINKEHKSELMFKGENDRLTKYELVPFSSPRVNYMLYGGLPMGRLIEFAGPDKSGKTTTALDMIKQCQHKFEKDYEKQIDAWENSKDKNKTQPIKKQVVFIDAENTFDTQWAKKLGVNVDEIYFIKPQTEYAEDIFETYKEIVETGEVGLIVLDSLAQLVSKQAMEKSIEEKTYGGIAMPLTKFCNLVVPLLSKFNCMGIVINQVREDLNSQYNEFVTPGGRAFKHNCSVRLMFSQGPFIDANNKELNRSCENPAGNFVKIKIEKSKICPNDRRLGFYTLKYSTGIDFMFDTISVLEKLGVINQRGAYFDLIDTETGEVLNTCQGKIKLVQYLEENEEVFNNLCKNIKYD